MAPLSMLRRPLLLVLVLGLSAACGPEAAGDPDGGTRDDGGSLVDGGAGDPDGGDPDGGGGSSAPEGCALEGGFPAPPADDPWADLDDLTGAALRDALLGRVTDHTWLTYNDARRAMFDVDTGIDVHDGEVECVYTGYRAPAEGATSNGFNVEHSWPQNEGADLEPARSDLHHLFVSTSDSNVRRSSYPFGFTDCDLDGSCLWQEAGSKLGERTDGIQRVFEVRPERRGDIARAHFYFAVRYELDIPGYEERALRCWSWSDPPDAMERARNDAIEAIQHNRNPFVDRPELVERIADF